MAHERSDEAKKAHQVDSDVPIDRARDIALNKLLARLADVQVPDHGDIPEIGLVEKAVLAVERVEGLEHDLERTNERLDELQDDVDKQAEVVDALEDITQQKTTKEQKIAAIVRFAEQKRDDDNEKMRVFPREIKGLLGVSQRYAYQLVEDISDEFEWARERKPNSKPTAKDGGGRQQVKKALEIDFEGVHGEAVPLNKFNNGIAKTEGTA